MLVRWGVILGALALLPLVASATAPAPPSSVQLLARTETSALIRWTPSPDSTRGFKIRTSQVPGVHPDPGLFPGGRSAAFTWTTDDGYDMNLVYGEIFASRGLSITAFVNSGTIGTSTKLTWSDVRSLHTQGHEIANHSRDHLSLIDDRAIALRRRGVDSCTVQITGSVLQTYVNGSLDLNLSLADPAQDHLVELVAVLDANPEYEATLLYSNLRIHATRSTFLDAITLPIGAGAPAGTLTTQRGVHDDAEMRAQILDCESELEAQIAIVDATYECRTLAYPNHAHTQWAMTTLNELGYAGARSGPQGEQPFFSEGSYAPGFMTSYETPLTYPRPDNSWTEAFTRSTYQTRVSEWKAANTWAILMAHSASESDSAHVAWMIDEIAADPDVWVATYREVIDFLNGYYLDVGIPVDPGTGAATAWVHDLDPLTWSYAVVTAYNEALEESAWSTEIEIPPFGVVGAPARPGMPVSSVSSLTLAPNPFSGTTRVDFAVPSEGPVRLDVFDVRGARVDERDLGVLPPGPHSVTWGAVGNRPWTGLYFVRIVGKGWSARGRAHLVR